MPKQSGKTFGQYELLEEIGEGGMATIFKARQTGLDRIVAIKILPEYLARQPGFIDRFKVEAQAIARLDHPHILPVYDFGQVDDTPYLVMKYVSAGTLKDMMQRGPLDPRQAASIVRQIAEALDHAHQQEVIHRDVKPSNVMMQEGRWVQLTDFGLAKILTSTSQLTASGASVGTPDYMSPEQAQGEPVDARSDIYSLGVILYQMLTGDVPFHAETPTGVMLKHVLEPPPPLRRNHPTLREPSEQVVMRALAKSPQDRFERAIDLAEAFERSLDENATQIATPTAPSNRTRNLLAMAGAGVLIALIAIVVIAALTPTVSAPTGDRLAKPSAPSTSQLGQALFDDFSLPQIDAARWAYYGTYTATLNSETVGVQNGRLAVQAVNSTDNTYYDGGAQLELERPVALLSARVTLLDATGFSDVGLQVKGLNGDPEAWAYLAMSPSDASVYGYLGGAQGTEETYSLMPGTGMPSTHELAIGWDGRQITFYVDGQAQRSVSATTFGTEFQLLFNVEPAGRVSGSFDDVRVTFEN